MKFKSILFLSLLVFSLSCNNSKGKIYILNTNFGQEVARMQNMIFTLSEDVLSDDAKIGTWEKTELIEFVPAIKGNFKWVAKNEVMFTPDAALGICQDYKAALSEKMLVYSKEKKKIDKTKQLEFHTPYLNLTNISAYWSLNESTGTPEIRLNTDFNYPLKPQAFVEKAKLTVNDKPAGFVLDDAAASENFSMGIRDRKALDEPTEISVILNKGLSPVGSSYKTSEEIRQTIVLSSPFELQVTSATTRFEEGLGMIDVMTSQQIDEKTLAAGYTIQPQISTTAEVSRNGFVIKGEFAEQVAYTLTINGSLRGVLGGKLKNDYSSNLFFGEMPPSISFSNKHAQFITNKGKQNIGLNIINIPQVQLQVTKIYRNNILLYMNNMRSYDYEYDEEGESSEGNDIYYDDYNEQYGSLIVDKAVDTRDLPSNKGISLLNVNLNDDKKFKGIYHIKVKSNGEDYSSASKLVSVSDIGILAKQSKNDLMVMANSLLTSEPLADVEIVLVSSNNQDIYTLKTNGEGIAHFTDMEQKTSGFRVAMITATQGEDFNYLLLNDNRVETARFETDGIQDNKAGWWAYIYGDRNIYRPGEKIYFNAVIRNDGMENMKNIPVIAKLVMPNGRVLSEKRLTTNAQGAAASDFSTSEGALTCAYSIQLFNSNDVLLNSSRISVEEFVPDKIKVNQTLNKLDFRQNDKIIYSGEALTFFGPPSRDRSYETEFTFRTEAFTAPKFPNYRFYMKDKIKFEPDVREGKTDEYGKFSEEFVIPDEWANSGYVKGNVFTTVFDENGRPVNRVKQLDIYTQPVFFGVASHDEWVGLNAPVNFDIIALNKDKNLNKTQGVMVEIVKLEWQNVLESYYGSFRYNSKAIEKVVSSKIISMPAGKTTYSYIPPVSGQYQLRVRLSGSSTGYTYSDFYAYQYGSTSSGSFEVSQEGEVIIVADQEKYTDGDKAKVLFKTPFNGKLLVTVERNKVFEYHMLDVVDKTASFNLDIREEHVPNIYISATLIKKASLSDIPLTVAHGLKNISVIKNNTQLPVNITANASSRSQTKQTIKIKTAPNAEVTVAIVDEGILSIKNFKSPDPYNYFYQKRALQVESFDLYARLFPEISSAATGGDAYGLEKRVNPLSVHRFEPVAIWSGVLKANGNGEVEFTAQIPKFYGAVRIMAVAYKDQAFGASEKEMKIFDPIVLSTSLPRFLSPGDEITMAVNLMNTTGNTSNIKASVQVSGPVELLQSDNNAYAIEAGKEKMILFTLKAKADIGKAEINVKISGANEVYTDKTAIAVRPAAGLQMWSSEGVLAAGKTEAVALPADFIGTPELHMTVHNSPLAQLSGMMSKLLRYPYGCAEQTISTAFPQLYFAEYAKSVGQFVNNDKLGENEMNPNYNVMEAIKKISALSGADGNISYWPGYYNYNLYLNAYALHFLSECDKKGFEVNQSLKSRLTTLCINQTSGVLEETDKIRSESGQWVERKFISREKIYALYVLALSGSPNRSAMNYCKMSQGKLHNASKYMLAGAYALSGDMKSFKELLPKTYARENDLIWSWNSFASPIRDKALVLNALIEADINQPQVLEMVRSLSSDIKRNTYFNTNEMSYSLLALGKYSQKKVVPGGKAVIMADGKKIGTYDGKSLVISQKGSYKNISIQSTGKGSVYYNCIYEGISSTGRITEEDKGLVVRRYFYNRKGESINVSDIRQNDLVVVKITIQTSFATGLKNVAITDILPAGLEIENPRITATKELDWIKDQSYASYMDVRDDRINYFMDLQAARSETLYYMCRAVSKGRFILGPVQADAMYDGSIHSYYGKGVLVVQ
jgi:uncharacterized protein YfaS (alpha-2-macroglobulin family)